MAITVKEFSIKEAANAAIYPMRYPILDTAANDQVLQVFYDSSWPTGTSRKIVLYFTGGAGADRLSVTTNRVMYTVNKGYIFVVFKAYNPNPIPYVRALYMPIRYQYWVGPEVELAIKTLYETVVKDTVISRYASAASKTCLLGHSRGGAGVLNWGTYAKTTFSKYAGNIVGAVANSPAGGGTGGANSKWTGQHLTTEAIFRMIQGVQCKTIAMIGVGDDTHSVRSHMERVNYMMTNPLAEIRFIGDNTYGHSWVSTEGQFKPFYDAAFELLGD